MLILLKGKLNFSVMMPKGKIKSKFGVLLSNKQSVNPRHRIKELWRSLWIILIT